MIKMILASLLLLGLILSPAAVLAQEGRDVPDQDAIIQNLGDRVDNGVDSDFGLPNNPADSTAVSNVLETVFLVAGGLSVVFITVGGLRYVISDGNDQKIQQAKETITYAIIGLVVSLSAYVVVRFFLSTIL